MRGFRKLICAAGLPPILAILAAGCGGNNTYNPDLVNLLPDFVMSVYRGPIVDVGDGTGKTPISQANPGTVDQNGSAPITIVIKSVNGLSGTVNLSNGAPSSNFAVTQPSPASLSLASGGHVDAGFTVTPGSGAGPGSTGTVVVTATSGNVSHTFTVYFQVVASGAGDFTVTLYNGDPNTVGDGTGLTPNSQQNRGSSVLAQTKFVTVVVKSVNGFTGNVTVSVPELSGPFSVTQPQPATINIPASSFKNTSFTFAAGEGAQPGQTGDASVSVTNGSITHTATAYFIVGNPN